jgi:hypothetical protein
VSSSPLPPTRSLAEAAALFRDNKPAFERNVAVSLRGGRIGDNAFPRLLRD